MAKYYPHYDANAHNGVDRRFDVTTKMEETGQFSGD